MPRTGLPSFSPNIVDLSGRKRAYSPFRNKNRIPIDVPSFGSPRTDSLDCCNTLDQYDGYPLGFSGERTLRQEYFQLFRCTELSDAAGHVIMYGVATIQWYWALSCHLQLRQALVVTLSLALSTGVFTELVQRFVPNRGSTLLDLTANWLGVLSSAVKKLDRIKPG